MVKYKLKREFDISPESYGGNQMWHSKKIHVKTGCGPVALSNLFAYHMGLKLDRIELVNLQEEILHYLRGPVIFPGQLIRGARKLFKTYELDISSRSVTLFSINSSKYTVLIELIKSSLDLDWPVALLTGPNKPFQGGVYRPDFKNHWVLITDMEYFQESREHIIHVSSWGECFELNLEKLIKSKIFVSVVSIKVLKEEQHS